MQKGPPLAPLREAPMEVEEKGAVLVQEDSAAVTQEEYTTVGDAIVSLAEAVVD